MLQASRLWHSNHLQNSILLKTVSIVYTSKIIIEDDIDVTLHESDEKSIHLEGRKEDISAIRWRIKDGVLYLSSRSGSLKDKVLVTVDVSGLKQIEPNGASEVKSPAIFIRGPLDIYLNGSCYVNIKNAGKITLFKWRRHWT